MTAYDSTLFAPPAPISRVTLRNPETGKIQTDVPMLLDTGADVTLVPQVALDLLGLQFDANKRYELESFDGSRSLVSVVHLELLFCHRTFRGRFLPVDQTWGVLGRNILNMVPLVFDGPNLQWDEFRSVRS